MSARIFYHGTNPAVAYSIMRQGFKVGEETSGRNLGAGLYLTGRVGFAATWGPIVIRCKLAQGTRILWHTPVDQGIIRSLKKEFGANITAASFSKVIPANKQLTRSEIAHLWNYLIERHYLNSKPTRRDFLPKLARNYPFIYNHLKRHGYDGVGMTKQEWPEMFLFNPSDAAPLSAHIYTSAGWHATWEKENVKLAAPLTLAELAEMQETELRRRNRFSTQE